MRSLNRLRRVLLLIILLCGGGIVAAREVLQGDSCVVEADEVILGTLFVVCEVLQIDGQVEGSIFGVALRSEISGSVRDNVYLLGGQLDISGHIHGDMHFAGAVLRLMPAESSALQSPVLPGPSAEITGPDADANAQIRGSLLSVTLSTSLMEGSYLAGSITGAGYQILIAGGTGGEVNFWGSGVNISGPVAGSVFATVGDPESSGSQIETLLLPLSFDIKLDNPGMVLTETGSVGGVLQYTGPASGQIDGRVAGDTNFISSQMVVLPTLEEPASITVYLTAVFNEVTTILAVGLLFLLLVPNAILIPVRNLRSRPFGSLSVGMLSFILSFPVVLIMLVLSSVVLVGLLLVGLDGVALAAAIMLGMLNLGGVGIFYFVAIFLARVIAALGLGRLLVYVLAGNSRLSVNHVFCMIVGVLVLALLSSLPVLGWVVNALALFLGLGTLLNVVLQRVQTMRDSGTGALSPAWYNDPQPAPEDMPVMQPRRPIPIANPSPSYPQRPRVPSLPPSTPGMQNLPEGFSFDFFNEPPRSSEPDDD